MAPYNDPIYLKVNGTHLALRKDLASKIKDADLVLSAVPGFLGFETLKKIILQGKNTVDISFFPENALELNQLALENNVTAIVDCGVAPGMDNVILGYYNETHNIVININKRLHNLVELK